MRRPVQSFGLLVLVFYAAFANSGNDVTGPCDSFNEEVPRTMKTTPKVSKDPNDGPLVVDVVCNPGYLLVPAEASRLHCINDTIWDDLPDCKAIPRVGFTKPAVNCSMNSLCNNLKIPVQLFGQFVREFSVNVTLDVSADGTSEVEEDGLFEIETTTLVFSTKDKESVEVKVEAKDTGVSGVSKIYTLCLTVLPSERNETRANVSNRCIVVKVINENKASLKLVQQDLFFTSGMQLLSFQVGYRACEINVTLCLHPIEKEICTNFTIPDNKMDIYTVDLLQQNTGVSLEIGSYEGKLVAPNDSCGAQITNSTLNVQWTLTPEEIHKYSVEIWVDNGPYDVNISLEGVPSLSTIPISVSKPLPTRFNISMNTNDLPYTTLCTIDGLAGDGGSGADIYDFIKTRFEAATDLTESYWMKLSAMTLPFVATVKGGDKGAQLILSFHAVASFTSNYSTELDVPINTSRSLKLDDYVIISFPDSKLSSEDYRLTKKSSVDWVLSLNPNNYGLAKFNLSMKKSDVAPPTFSVGTPNTTTITIGTELSFEAKKYDVGDKVVIKSSRDLKGNDNFKLNKLVDLKCIPDDVITLHADGAWVDGGKVEVSFTRSKKDAVNVTISFTVKGEMKELVAISESFKVTTVVLPAEKKDVTATLTPEEEDSETTSSWPFGGMIAVLIGVVVVAVVAYVGYSNRQKVWHVNLNIFTLSLPCPLRISFLPLTLQIMSYVGGGGGGGEGGAGKGLISKARKRFRSRGAYKKLPTSVQDAMTGHND